MLSNNAKNSSLQADSDLSAPTVSDPWTTPSPVQEENAVPKTWHLLTETSPLIGPAGSPDAPKIASHQSTSEEILLEDELEKALALLYWWKK